MELLHLVMKIEKETLEKRVGNMEIQKGFLVWNVLEVQTRLNGKKVENRIQMAEKWTGLETAKSTDAEKILEKMLEMTLAGKQILDPGTVP